MNKKIFYETVYYLNLMSMCRNDDIICETRLGYSFKKKSVKFYRLVSENFLNISDNDFYNIFYDSIDKIINDIENDKIKSDKKLFYAIQKELLYLMENNNILKSEIERHDIYEFYFKTNQYYILDGLNYNFFRLETKNKYK